MPELPEVEVVKRSLESKIQNKIIKKVKINDIKLRYKLNIKKISQQCTSLELHSITSIDGGAN